MDLYEILACADTTGRYERLVNRYRRFGKGGGPSLKQIEASNMRVMNAQMVLQEESSVRAEERLRAQIEQDRLQEKERLKEAARTEADELQKRESLEQAATAELSGAVSSSGGKASGELGINLDAPKIERPDYEGFGNQDF